MLPKLVTYYIHRRPQLPPNDALSYQYILAGNGVFVRAETRFFEAIVPISYCSVRGLPPLEAHFQLKVPLLPGRLLDTVLTDACTARRPDSTLNEVLYQFHHCGSSVQVRKPPQRATAASVVTRAATEEASIILDLHSHGRLPAFFSATDNADEQGARLYAVIGRIDTKPEIRLRLGLYGTWLSLPLAAVFADTDGTDVRPFKDLYQEKPHDPLRYNHRTGCRTA